MCNCVNLEAELNLEGLMKNLRHPYETIPSLREKLNRKNVMK